MPPLNAEAFFVSNGREADMTEKIETSEAFLAKNPHLATFIPFLDSLKSESARGSVLISTGYLEQLLKETLLAFMLDNPTSRNLVEGPNAPFGTFSSRIGGCYALGLISEDEHHDLQLIRRVRNDFAHDIATNFATQTVSGRCAALRGKAFTYTLHTGEEVKVPPASQFSTAAVSLICNLVNRAHYVAQKRVSPAKWPY